MGTPLGLLPDSTWEHPLRDTIELVIPRLMLSMVGKIDQRERKGGDREQGSKRALSSASERTYPTAFLSAPQTLQLSSDLRTFALNNFPFLCLNNFSLR